MKKIACIVKGYPRLSETFIAQEIYALEQAGVDIIIYSLRHPTDPSVHPIHEKISAKVHYLPEYLYQHPLRFLTALFKSLFKPVFYSVLAAFVRDFTRDFTPNRGRRFGQALVLANEIEADREWIYVHFLHTPASVAAYTSKLVKLPWSCSAHAKDIWTSAQWDLREKLADLRWLVTCTQSNVDFLKDLSPIPEKVSLLYHGLDLSRFPQPTGSSAANGEDASQPVTLISVGRTVNKKGYDILLNALSRLDKRLHWRFIHIGGGPLLDRLKAQARSLAINDRINWMGAQSFETVIESYQSADLFVLASRIDSDGDRDGLPNVLMEAMSQGLPCIATNISGIPEIISNRTNGILVTPENPEELTRAITELIESPNLRGQLGNNGYKTVSGKFSLDKNIQQLVNRFK